MQDQRRKLDPLDYSRIRLGYDMNCTIRELANTYGVSTKYIKKVITAQVIFQEDGPTRFIMSDGLSPVGEKSFCSGCGSAFGSRSGLMLHADIWTSGGIKDLECVAVMPPLAR